MVLLITLEKKKPNPGNDLHFRMLQCVWPLQFRHRSGFSAPPQFYNGTHLLAKNAQHAATIVIIEIIFIPTVQRNEHGITGKNNFTIATFVAFYLASPSTLYKTI